MDTSRNPVVNLASKADQNGTILVLNSIGGWKPALLVNSEGEVNELSCFERDDNTEAFMSCSVNWQNQLHVFGGNRERRQISRLNGYRLERIGDLAFDHNFGACSVMADQYIFLCFNTPSSSDHSLCRRSTGPLETFTELPLTNHRHRTTATSCSESKSCCLVSH